MSKTIRDLLAELQQAWDLALAQENPTPMIEASWKQAVLLGLVTEKVELRLTVEGDGISPSQAIEQAITRTITTRRH